MKFKYQQGGQFGMPYVVYQPTPDLEQNPAPQKKKSGDGSSNNADELYKMLSNLKDSLPGDLQAAQSSLKNLFESIQYKQQMGDTDSIAFEYLKALNLVSKLKYEAENFVKARDHAIEKGSLTEYAINSKGQVIVFSEEGFEWKTPEEIAQNPDKYQPITNQELLDYRAQGVGGLAFNSSAISTVQNSISMSQVTDIINNAVDKLGKDSTSEDGYAKIKAGQLIQGLQDFVKARSVSDKYDATVEDLYVANLLTEDQAKQAKQALLYIYNMMPNNAMTLLKMKSNGTVEGAKLLIDTLVESKLGNTTKLNQLSLKGGPTSSKTNNVGDSDKSNPYLQLLRGQGGSQSKFTIVPGKPGEDKIGEGNEGMSVVGTKYPALPNVHEEMSLDALLATGLDYLDISNKRGICFGDQLLNKSDFSHVMFDNEGAYVVTLPVMYDMLGNPRVNLSLLDDYELVKKELSKYKHLSEDALRQKEAELLHTYELDELIDPNTGLPDQTRTANFLVIGAYTTDKIELDKNSRFIEKIDKPSEHLTQRIIRGLSLDKDKSDYDIDVNDRWSIFEWGYDDVYRANVFIPLTQNPNAAFNAQGTDISETTTAKHEKQYRDFIKLTKMKPTNDE